MVSQIIMHFLETLEGDPALASRLRSALGAAPVDPWVPLEVVADELGMTPRACKGSLRRAGITIGELGDARVVRRSALDAYLAASGRVAAPVQTANTATAVGVSSITKVAARLKRAS